MYNLIIFGPPGVGKGTQSQLISEKMNITHFSTGEILRKAVSEETELGKKAKEVMENGCLIPDDIMIGIVKDALTHPPVVNGFILDGFPRTIEQAKALTVLFKELNLTDIKIIYLTSDDEEIVRRLMKRGRSDDTEATIENRLNIFSETTSSVIDYYKDNEKVYTVNGVGEVDDINKEIIRKISEN